MWGMLPVMVLAGISGIFYPIQRCGAGCRSSPRCSRCTGWDSACARRSCRTSAAVEEIGDSWRTLETVLVLGVWAVVGALVTPILLRRMARRQTGSQVEAAREATMQWVK